MVAVMVYLLSVPVSLVPQDKDNPSLYVIKNNDDDDDDDNNNNNNNNN